MTGVRLGLGTYRIRPSALTAAVERAATTGAQEPTDSVGGWVDTAPNYLDGMAQRLLAKPLARHPVPVSTKVGFLTPVTARDALAASVLTEADRVHGHCLTPAYVHWQCARNRTELGRPQLDFVFVHNPEQLEGDPHPALLEAFTALEEQAAAGTLGSYGIATWSALDSGLLDVPTLDALATLAAGTRDHHLRGIQTPVSLVTAGAFSDAIDGHGPLLQAADRGWRVFASAPLFGGELPALAGRELADLIDSDLTVAQCCLLATASCPGVTDVLLAASTSEHWAQASAAVSHPALPHPTLRKVLDVLAAP